ncbi:MAG: trypsin-like peptidase domain-containing protein [Planctomycetes bacterium]|nr:trypsin-like peptidase domain-containing protein [Planctomycetota bacterium]
MPAPRLVAAICLLVTAVAPCRGLDDDARQKAKDELLALGKQLSVLSRAFNLVHEVVAPCVVSIHTRAQVSTPIGWGLQQSGEVEVGEGSGFVFASDERASWMLTNAHVVLQTNHDQEFVRGRDNKPVGYDRLIVQLNDNRQVEAEYVGFDLSTDLAVVKVAIPHLPTCDWGNSDQVHVGDWVVALGYPLGVGYSATSGIVSATDRSTGIYDAMRGLESFIQTDAAINPGNSGGPLVSIEGRIIGVNANILSRTGSNVGIGFAIPSNLARHVAEDLIANGRVRWPGIGIDMDVLAPEQAQELGLAPVQAVRIIHVLPKTPAKAGGLDINDVILAVNTLPIQSLMQFRARVASCRVGEPMALRIWRAGKVLDKQVTPVDRDEILKNRAQQAEAATHDLAISDFGMSLATDDRPGLVVTEIQAGSPADAAHLAVGDRLLHERSLGELRTLEDASKITKRKEVTVEVLRDGKGYWVRMRK